MDALLVGGDARGGLRVQVEDLGGALGGVGACEHDSVGLGLGARGGGAAALVSKGRALPQVVGKQLLMTRRVSRCAPFATLVNVPIALNERTVAISARGVRFLRKRVRPRLVILYSLKLVLPRATRRVRVGSQTCSQVAQRQNLLGLTLGAGWVLRVASNVALGRVRLQLLAILRSWRFYIVNRRAPFLHGLLLP